jgi:hypothetical protein
MQRKLKPVPLPEIEPRLPIGPSHSPSTTVTKLFRLPDRFLEEMEKYSPHKCLKEQYINIQHWK